MVNNYIWGCSVSLNDNFVKKKKKRKEEEEKETFFWQVEDKRRIAHRSLSNFICISQAAK